MQRFSPPTRGLGTGTDDEAIYTKNKDDPIRYATVLVGPDRAEVVVSTVMVRVLRKTNALISGHAEGVPVQIGPQRVKGAPRKRQAIPIPDGAVALVVPEPDWEVVHRVVRLPARQHAAVFLRYSKTDGPLYQRQEFD